MGVVLVFVDVFVFVRIVCCYLIEVCVCGLFGNVVVFEIWVFCIFIYVCVGVWLVNVFDVLKYILVV